MEFSSRGEIEKSSSSSRPSRHFFAILAVQPSPPVLKNAPENDGLLGDLGGSSPRSQR